MTLREFSLFTPRPLPFLSSLSLQKKNRSIIVAGVFDQPLSSSTITTTVVLPLLCPRQLLSPNMKNRSNCFPIVSIDLHRQRNNCQANFEFLFCVQNWENVSVDIQKSSRAKLPNFKWYCLIRTRSHCVNYFVVLILEMLCKNVRGHCKRLECLNLPCMDLCTFLFIYLCTW